MLPLLGTLVSFLQRVIADPVVEVERPLYLNEATLETPDAAVEAVRKETVRLYDLAVEVMADGLSIRRDLLGAREKPKRIVRQSSQVIDEDINDLYERKLKVLFGAIVEFVIRVHGGYAKGRLREDLNQTRQAGQHVIEAVKGVKHLRKNLVHFMRSDNVHIRKEYDKLRRMIVKVLERIDVARTSEDPAAAARSLHGLNFDIDVKVDEIVNGLDELIREHAINVTMATSLMNDITYCEEICLDLVAAGSTLFLSRDV
jgi:phosphate:Na+ symporter